MLCERTTPEQHDALALVRSTGIVDWNGSLEQQKLLLQVVVQQQIGTEAKCGEWRGPMSKTERMSFSFEKDIKKRVGYMQLCIRHMVTQIETAYCSHMNGGDSVGTGGKGSGCTYGVVG